jgi:hypothetical protein
MAGVLLASVLLADALLADSLLADIFWPAVFSITRAFHFFTRIEFSYQFLLPAPMAQALMTPAPDGGNKFCPSLSGI